MLGSERSLASHNPEEYHTSDAVAALLRVTSSTVRRWIREGRLGAVVVGREYRIAASEVVRYLSTLPSRVPGTSSIEH